MCSPATCWTKSTDMLDALEAFMSWLLRSSVSEARSDFLRDHARGVPVDDLCETYDVCRSTAYALIAKAKAVGVEAAVADRSRAPHSSPNALPSRTRELILSMRAQFGYGPGKLAFLCRELRRRAQLRVFLPATFRRGRIVVGEVDRHHR